jgi:hypothetical protein
MPARKAAKKRRSAKKTTAKRTPAKKKAAKKRTTKRRVSKRRGNKRGAVGREKEICFTIMPFGGWLDEYYETIYCPAIEAAGLKPRRADDLFRPGTIVTDIWDYTRQAKLLLADLTGKNPNVFYELGLAHALKKPAILVAESMDDIPFDLRALRIIIYDKNAPNWGKILREKIETSLEEVEKAPAGALLPAFLETRSTAKPAVTPREKEILQLRQELNVLRREVLTGSRMEEPSQSLDVGPTEARRLIANFARAGATDAFIVEQLEQMGVPKTFIIDEIKRVPRSRRRKTPAG